MKRPGMRGAALILGGLLLAALAVMTAFTDKPSTPKYHYEVRRDLSVYFANADEVIESVRNSLKARKSSVTVSYISHSDNMEDIDALVSELMGFALSETEDPACGDYIFYQYGGYETLYSYTKEGGSYRYEIVITPIWYTTRAQEEQVDKRVDEILSSLSLDGLSDEERISRIYGWVCDNVSFDLIHEKNRSYHLKATAYGALINRTATCQGYAVTLYRLLREAGIDAGVVTGIAVTSDGSEEYHAWVRIGLNGEYFCSDPTWDSASGSREFYMIPESEFPRHTPDPGR
ncbi:MAG: lasso peptide biosynthesis protein [Ruminococcus sp.]|nr:lasso peptide biosynthesis protein [Ruminococcus sp.]